MTTKIKAEIRPYELQRLIGETKEYFALQLRKELGLVKVEGPLFVEKNTGINDDLNGVERPVRFTASALGEKQLEIKTFGPDKPNYYLKNRRGVHRRATDVTSASFWTNLYCS